MEALYGMLIAVPTVWACAGYVLVSHPGTAEVSDSRAPATHGVSKTSTLAAF
jgi:hypothetical protein